MAILDEEVADFVRKVVRLETVSRTDKSSPYNQLHAAANRAFDSIMAHGEAGRQAMEKLLGHGSPEVRFWAACAVLDWDPKLAVPVFGRLLRDPLPETLHVDARIDIRFFSGDRLFQYFGDTSHNLNNLIEPLRAYGIDLPPSEERPWFD